MIRIMVKVLFLTLALTLAASCASKTITEMNKSAKVNASANESEQRRDVPPEFREVDFKNISYPISRAKTTIQLKDGKREYYEDKVMGSGWLDFEGVDYFDVTGDGKKEAIARLFWVTCGGSCDGGSHLLYIYSTQQNKLNLLWQFETGSLGYGCGLKSLDIRRQKITLEVFKKCDFDGPFLKDEFNPQEEAGGKYYAKSFTRFIFEFNGKAFVLKNREVFPNPEENVMNYSPAIHIGDEL